jgi:uncharacterized protein YggE
VLAIKPVIEHAEGSGPTEALLSTINYQLIHSCPVSIVRLAEQRSVSHPGLMKTIILFSLVILPTFVLAQGGLPTQPYIYVEGKGEIQKPADLVTLRFNVVARDPDQPKANQQAQAAAGKILSMLDERKVAKDDVVAQDLRSEPNIEVEEISGRRHEKLVGFTVTRPFEVKLRDLAALSKLVNDLIGTGRVEFSSIDAGVSDREQKREEVWKKALADAHDQAEKTLKTVSMKIDSVFAISPVPFPDIQQEMFRSRTGGTAGVEERHMIELSPLEYRLAPVTISESAYVIYLISPLK